MATSPGEATDDREVWLIAGAPDGEELFDAIGAVLDQFAPRVRVAVG